ncbi:hypothetical protein MCOR03_007188, partial [Pyricularia oryzae]
ATSGGSTIFDLASCERSPGGDNEGYELQDFVRGDDGGSLCEIEDEDSGVGETAGTNMLCICEISTKLLVNRGEVSLAVRPGAKVWRSDDSGSVAKSMASKVVVIRDNGDGGPWLDGVGVTLRSRAVSQA